ncbi:MFS transporter [Lachnoclostridium sp.]|nr:MFS transporter [Lachnoclostridium sp.]
MEYRLNKIDSPVYVKRLFFLCWLVYCTSYLGRLNYSAAMTVMIKENVLDSSQAGFISMLYFFAYGIGQMVNGFLGDRIDPKKMILIGIGVSAVANACMGLAGGFLVMALIWGINGYFQSMIWAPIIRIFAEMLNENNKINCSVNISSSGVVGTLLSYLLSAILIARLHWKFVFFVASILLFLVAIVFWFGFQSVLTFSNRNLEAKGDETRVDKEQIKKQAGQRTDFKTILFCSEILFIMIPIIIHGVLKDGVTAWVPTYISSSFGLAPSFSILITTVLPIVNLAGAYVGWAIYRRMKENIAKSNMVFFVGSLASLILLLVFGRVSVILTVALLAIITSSMMAVNTLSISVYPLRFEKDGRVSSVSGFLNAMAYIGTAISTFAIGLIVKYRGWEVTIITWLVMTVIASAICFMAVKKLEVSKISKVTNNKEERNEK